MKYISSSKCSLYFFFLFSYLCSRLILCRVTGNELATKQSLKPTIYTFVDYDSSYFYENQLNLFQRRWNEAGWDVGILIVSDAKNHSEYETFLERFDRSESNREKLNGFLSYMAMSNLPDGGIYAHYEVLPLHEYSQVALPSIDDSGKRTEEILISFDMFDDSLLYGNFNGWNKATELVTKDVRNNGELRLQKLEYGMPSMKTVSLVALLDGREKDVRISFDRAALHGSGFGYAFTACKLAKDHYAIRIRSSFWTQDAYKNSFSARFMEFYDNQCFLSRDGISEHLADKLEMFQNNRPLDVRYSILHVSDVLDENSKSEVTCSRHSCKIKNACITSSSRIMLFGSNDHVAKEKGKFKHNIKKQAYVHEGVLNAVYELIGRAEGSHKVKDGVATMGAGFTNNPCNLHMQFVVWPLIRLNLHYRDKQDVINNGVGDLFLHSINNMLSCNVIYTPMSEKVNLYRYIPEDTMKCYRDILVGTSLNQAKIEHNFAEDVAVMRSLYYNALNINENLNMNLIIIARQKDVSLDTLKEPHRKIFNANEVYDMIKHLYSPSYQVKLVQWDDYSLKDQIKMLARTKLLITLSGSSSIQPVFMQDDAAIINFCNAIDDKKDWFFIANMKSRNLYKKYCGIQKDMRVNGRMHSVVDIQMLRKTVQTLLH